MAPRRLTVPVPLITAFVAVLAGVGVVGWRLNVQRMTADVQQKRSALKKLTLVNGLPPNQDVMDYLSARQQALEGRYQRWVELIAPIPTAAAAGTDPQLYFQEQLHEVQRTLERLSAARGMPAPEQLGFPKELPPLETVSRLLAQLSLSQEVATLMLEHGVPALTSLKIEDPEPVEAPAEEESPFLVRLPVRVRLACSLAQLMKVLGAMERVTPLIDVRALRMLAANPPSISGEGQARQPDDGGGSTPAQSAGSSQAPKRSPQEPGSPPRGASPEPERLEVELTVARYLVTEPSPEASTDEEAHEASPQRGAGSPRRSSGSARPKTSEHGGPSTKAGSRKVPRKEPAHADE
ncbi:MAG: GspMb/PilO family protein [Candidatus Omnitrophota bacterium]|nr:GspMb/PilO family protein [Candidatus Omnitrophota bacterium]